MPTRRNGLPAELLGLERVHAEAIALSNDAVSRAQTPARVASIAQDQMTGESAALETCLQHAPQGRLLVEQAKGFISAQSRLDIDDASNGPRSDARSNIQRLTAVARDVIAGPTIIGSGTPGGRRLTAPS